MRGRGVLFDRLGGWARPRRRGLTAGGFAGFFSIIAFAVAVGLQSPPPPSPSPSPSPTPPALAVTSPSPVPPSPSPSLSPAATAATTPTPTPAPTPLGPNAPLDGMPADPLVGHRLPLAVMVDDNVRTRPQAGYSRASIVYQAPTDGGEDRYMLIFQEQDAELVGNVRSTRYYYVAWASEYRAALGHYGGDHRSLSRLPTIDGRLVYDVDALSGGGRAFWRDKSAGRAPFNAFTSTERVRSVALAHGAPESMVGTLAARPFADDLPADERPAAGSINIAYRRGDTSYTYDHRSNSYLRSVAGKPQLDKLDGSRVTARNVIVQFVSLSYNRTERHNRVAMDVFGSGRAIVFRDGKAIEGTWRKRDGNAALTRFLDADGNEVSLVRGPIFIQVVPDNAAVTYKIGE